jgi:hypothetical protein
MSGRDVFINCPFSPDYQINFQAVIFTIVRSGFTPRCARENDDAGEVRIDKICRIIRDCPYSVHDISVTELDPDSHLPRFNMPFELGLFLGARKFGGRAQRLKKTLVLDRDQFRYQKYISDIAGQDIHSHGGDVQQLTRELANWLRDEARDPKVPGGAAISSEFAGFKHDLPLIAGKKRLQVSELTFKDLAEIAAFWVVQASGSK